MLWSKEHLRSEAEPSELWSESSYLMFTFYTLLRRQSFYFFPFLPSVGVLYCLNMWLSWRSPDTDSWKELWLCKVLSITNSLRSPSTSHPEGPDPLNSGPWLLSRSPQKATVNEAALEKSSCVIAAAALYFSQRGSGAYFGVRWGPTSCRPCIFFSLSALHCSWRCGPAEEGPRGHSSQMQSLL